MRQVVLAKSAGFCYGVRRAVELAEEKAAQGTPCVMLGSIIHNRDVVDRLAAQGLRSVDRPEDVPDGGAVIIRSHGESRATRIWQNGGCRFSMLPAQTLPESTKLWQKRRKKAGKA